jgi:hypothetical protein
MPEITLKIDPVQLEDITETLKGVAGGLGKAQSAAINRTMTHVRAVASREIKKHINLPIAVIKEAIDLRKKALPAYPVGTVQFRHKPVPLIDYDARDEFPRGVSAMQRTDQGRQKFSHYFFATMPNGHRGVFRRMDDARSRKIKGRWTALPIREVFGATVVGTFERAPGVWRDVLKDSGEFLAKQLASQVNRLLKRKKVDESDAEEG